MTTTPTASPALPDLGRLEALARAALGLPDTMQPFVSRGSQLVVEAHSLSGEQLHTVAGFYDAASPAAVLALIATARRNERMFMAACVDLGLINEALSLDPDDGGADPILGAIEELKQASRARPEGEAPQADWIGAVLLDVAELPDRDSPEEWPEAMLVTGDELRTLIALHAPAATLSPLCGAQHAESGKEEFAWAVFAENGNVIIWSRSRAQVESASKEYGRPIKPVIARSAAQQAAAPGELSAKPVAYAIYGIARGKHSLHDVRQIEPGDGDNWKTDDGGLGDYWSGNEPLFASSAPGTPEAPSGLPRLYRFDCYVGKTKMAAGVGVHAITMEEAEQKARKLADKNETIKFESNQPCHATRKCSICAEYERAAQLDGGQEGSES